MRLNGVIANKRYEKEDSILMYGVHWKAIGKLYYVPLAGRPKPDQKFVVILTVGYRLNNEQMWMTDSQAENWCKKKGIF